MRKGRNAHSSELPEDDAKVFFWLDYVVLRQCQNDFELPRIMGCIKDIGFTLVEVLTIPCPSDGAAPSIRRPPSLRY